MGNLIHDLSCHVRTIQGIRLTLLVHLANPTAPRPASWEVPPKVAFLASMSSLTHAYLGHEQYPFTSSASSLSDLTQWNGQSSQLVEDLRTRQLRSTRSSSRCEEATETSHTLLYHLLYALPPPNAVSTWSESIDSL
jgi:hypothetical protein